MSEKAARTRILRKKRKANARRPDDADFQSSQPGFAPEALNTSDVVMNLQRTIGNQALQRLLNDQRMAEPGSMNLQRLIQRQSDDHGGGCGCPACAGRVQRMVDQVVQARPTVQRADDHDIQRWPSWWPWGGGDKDKGEDKDTPADTVPARLTQLDKQKANLFKKFKVIFKEFDNVTFDDLKPHIAKAPQDERDKVWKSKTMMKKVVKGMSEADYLDLLPALAVFKKGKTAEDKRSHTKADDADKFIRQYLGDQVEEAVKRGSSVKGWVAVVDGADWLKAYEAEFGNDGLEDTTNAFVDQQDRIWVHKKRGNAGTVIHEGVHKYAVDGFLSEVGFNFNEGVTEFFTRKICEQLKYDRGNYEDNYEFAKEFVNLMGEDRVAKAYFDGEVDAIKTAFAEKGKSWADLLQFVRDKDWDEAIDLLKAPAPDPTPVDTETVIV